MINIVSATCRESEIAYEVDQATKRSLLVVCIGADRTYLKPTLILPKRTIERGVLEHEFISTGLFEEWCEEVFKIEIQRPREVTGHAGDAVSINDGPTCHESDGFEDGCLDNGMCMQ
jgi:hypothetical protein